MVCAGCATDTPRAEHPYLPPRQPVRDDLPASFTDRVLNLDKGYTRFEMILVPGNPEHDMPPFYIGRTEVTWDMFMAWAWGTYLDDASELARLERQGLRPSYIGHGHPQFEYGFTSNGRLPATGLSWQTARLYCIWLSAMTGRSYRLPTDSEWDHVFKLAGGMPETREALLAHGAFLDNTKEMDTPPFVNAPREVAQGEPDALGLYDLVGNAAEWVQPMAGRRWVRGGHYELPADDFIAGWRAFEDQDVWNASYPALPRSRHWYIDHIYQGFRLVCEVERVDNIEIR